MHRNFPDLTIVHEGELPPEQFEVEIPGRNTSVVARRLDKSDSETIRQGISTSEERLRPWLTWRDRNGDRNQWSRVAEAVANEFATANWWNRRLWFNWVLYNAKANEFIGMVDTGPKGDQTFEIGYWTTASRNARGVMLPVVQTVARLDFDILGAQRLVLEVNDANEASKRIAFELGAGVEHETNETPLPDTLRSASNLAFVLNKPPISRRPGVDS